MGIRHGVRHCPVSSGEAEFGRTSRGGPRWTVTVRRVTATPERNIAASSDRGAVEWAARSTFGTRGLPWWGSVVLAVLLTAAGTLADTLIWSEPGILFTASYVVGCLLAVALVRRASLFGPMVQPPLVLALAMPLVVVAVGAGVPDGAGTTATVLAIVSPLISGFPAMAITTALVLGVGFARMYWLERATAREDSQQAHPDATTKQAAPKERKRPRSGDRGSGEKTSQRKKDGGASQRPAGSGSGPRPSRGGAEREQRAAGRPGRDAAPGRGKRPAESTGNAARGESGRAPGRQRPAQDQKPAPGRPGGTGKQAPPGKQGGAGRQAAPGKQGSPGKQGAPGKQAAPGKQGARPRSQGPAGPARDGGQRGGGQGGQPGRPDRGDRPAPPGRGGPRQAPPGRGNKPPQRQPGGEPPKGQPRRPRRDD